jgi:hypothetical protein
MASFFGTIGIFVVPETSHSRILQIRAQKIRFETKNWAVHAKADETPLDLHAVIHIYLFKPFIMLVKEPILLLITIYLAYIYGILYLFFTAYPISFQRERGWNQGVGALPFIGILIGVLLGSITITYVTKTRFARKLKKHGRVIPEERLVPMIFGAVIFPIGLFWFAWTSSPHITWVPQAISGIFIGWGILMIFLQGLNYLIDVYLWHANSAIAANTLIRALAGAGFPMFATAMYDKLGVAVSIYFICFLTFASCISSETSTAQDIVCVLQHGDLTICKSHCRSQQLLMVRDCTVGFITPRIPQRSHDPGPHPVLLLRKEDQKDEQV